MDSGERGGGFVPPRLDQRAVGVALLGLLIFLAHASFPSELEGTGLDTSWAQGLAYALHHRFQCGVDTVFTFGPLGYFSQARYDPALFWPKILLFEVALKGAAAAMVLFAVLRLRGVMDRALFVFALVVPGMGNDAYAFLTLLAAAGWIFARREKPVRAHLVPLAVVLALGLVKFTYLILAGGVVLAAAAVVERARGRRAGWSLVAVAALLLLVLWTAAGQSPLNLFAYVRSSLWVVEGYPDGMAWKGPDEELRLAVVVASLAVASAACFVATRPRDVGRWTYALLASAALFLAFKAGFVRHMGNAVLYFGFAAAMPFLVASTARGPLDPTGRARLFRALEAALRYACLVAGLYGYGEVRHILRGHEDRYVADAAARVISAGWTLAKLGELRSELEEERAEVHAEAALPRVRETVGDAPVDLFLHDQAYVFLNDLTWRPRPVFQSYVAYSPRLVELNARFYEGPHAPPWVLLDFQPTDSLPGANDGEALRMLGRDYELVLEEKECLLLARKQGAPLREQDHREVVLERTFSLGEVLDIPAIDGAVLVVEIEVDYSLAGRLERFLVRGAPLVVDVGLSSGRAARHRGVPGSLRTGFLAAPFLETREAWKSWLEEGEAPERVEKIKLSTGVAYAGSFRREATIRVIRADGLRPGRER